MTGRDLAAWRELAAATELLAEPELDRAVDDLGAATRLRARYPAELVARAVQQASLRRRARDKFDDAGRLLFTRDGLEQASGRLPARHRAARIAASVPVGSAPVLDLCCGVGGDAMALAATGMSVLAVDRDPVHAFLTRCNTTAEGHPVSVAAADVRMLRIGTAATVYVDPARRTRSSGGDRRGGYEPTLGWCTALTAAHVAVKAAPGVDHRSVPAGWEAEFVAVGRELKEAVLWSPSWAGAVRRATVLEGATVHSLAADPEAPPAEVRPPGRYLFDPSPAVTRAGAVADLARRLGAWQLDPRIAFLSSDETTDTAFARVLVIEASLPFSLKAVAAELRRLDIGALDIRRRGLAGDVDELRRRLRPRGTRAGVLAITRLDERPWALLATALPPTT